MVFRPEGAADLRQHLRGSRIPADVYLRRKMQAVDPDLGPVMPLSAADRAAAPPPTEAPAPPAGEPAAAAPRLLPAEPAAHAAAAETPPASPAAPASEERSPSRRSGVRSLAEFDPPLPPPARTPEEIEALLAWMLDHDPLIPNNLPRLEAIHASVFHAGQAGRLDYRRHVMLQAADDLTLHDTQDALQGHLECLAAAYRRAALSYGRAMDGKPEEVDVVLWRMASFASRLRLEAWIYQSRHGVPAPLLAAARSPRARRK
jgi:hypothetical protein